MTRRFLSAQKARWRPAAALTVMAVMGLYGARTAARGAGPGPAAPAAPAGGQGAGRGAAPARGTTAAAPAAAQPAQMPLLPFEWWNDADVKKELGLAPDKVKAIDDIYQRRSHDLAPIAAKLDDEQHVLEKMTDDRVADESAYSLEVLFVESMRAQLRETRTTMLYRMYRQLSVDQYKKLQDIMTNKFGRGRSGPPPAR